MPDVVSCVKKSGFRMMDVGSLCEKYEILKHMASFVANMKCYESTLKGGMDHIVWIFFDHSLGRPVHFWSINLSLFV